MRALDSMIPSLITVLGLSRVLRGTYDPETEDGGGESVDVILYGNRLPCESEEDSADMLFPTPAG